LTLETSPEPFPTCVELVCVPSGEVKAFQVTMSGGDSHTFDSFECAVHALAPTCEHCNVKVIGHGVEADSRFFCCAHCASMAGIGGVADRA
jgi:hypothetical protein